MELQFVSWCLIQKKTKKNEGREWFIEPSPKSSHAKKKATTSMSHLCSSSFTVSLFYLPHRLLCFFFLICLCKMYVREKVLSLLLPTIISFLSLSLLIIYFVHFIACRMLGFSSTEYLQHMYFLSISVVVSFGCVIINNTGMLCPSYQ